MQDVKYKKPSGEVVDNLIYIKHVAYVIEIRQVIGVLIGTSKFLHNDANLFLGSSEVEQTTVNR